MSSPAPLTPILDEKALDSTRGPFAKIYPISEAICEIMTPVGPEGITIICEKKNAAAYISQDYVENFIKMCPKNAVLTRRAGYPFAIYLPIDVAPCCQAVAAFVMRAAYGVSIRLYNLDGVRKLQVLAMHFGALSVLDEINIAMFKFTKSDGEYAQMQ